MLKKGDLKFVLDGEKLKGGWVLVRMRSDKFKSKRNNWLLIKHHDGLEKAGDEDALLKKKDKSIASGRSMDQIEAGKGKKAQGVHAQEGVRARRGVGMSVAKKTVRRHDRHGRDAFTPRQGIVARHHASSISRAISRPSAIG